MPDTTTAEPTTSKKSAPLKGGRPPSRSSKRKQTASATNLILERIGVLDDRISGIVDGNSGAGSAQINETLKSQTTAMVEVAAALSNLQSSMITAVTNAIDDRLSSREEIRPNAVESFAAVESGGDAEGKQPSGDAIPESSWNDIREAFLASHGEARPVACEVAEDVEGAKSVEAVEAVEETHEAETEQEEFAVFSAIDDPDALNEQELRNAVVEQERVITLLSGRLQKRVRAAQALSVEQISELQESLPEELKIQVEKALKSLEQQQRYGELELSLERARISRQSSRLEVTRDRLNARASAMGLQISENGELEGGENNAKRGSKGRNWLGVMGFGN